MSWRSLPGCCLQGQEQEEARPRSFLLLAALSLLGGIPARLPRSPDPRGRCRTRRAPPEGGSASTSGKDAQREERLRHSADRAKLLAGSCLQGGCSTAASINLWGTPASAAQAEPSDGARTWRAGRLQPDYKNPTRSQPPEPKCLCVAQQPALSAFISSPCVYEGGSLLSSLLLLCQEC